MNKYNNIAVFIRGQTRIWDSCKLNQFYYYSQIAHHVDYYFTTWQDSSTDSSKIKKDFDGKSLIEYIEVPLNDTFKDAWLAPAYMAYHTIPFKKKREQQIKYDAVFDQRTDSIIWQQYSVFELDPMTMYTPMPPFDNAADRIALGHGDIGITDYGHMSDSVTYDLLANRVFVLDQEMHSPERRLMNYCNDHNIDMPGLSVINFLPVRPDICRDFKNSILAVDDSLRNRLNLSHNIWKDIPLAEKLQILQDHGLQVDHFSDPKFGLN